VGRPPYSRFPQCIKLSDSGSEPSVSAQFTVTSWELTTLLTATHTK
jgi:hypothetical protein